MAGASKAGPARSAVSPQVRADRGSQGQGQGGPAAYSKLGLAGYLRMTARKPSAALLLPGPGSQPRKRKGGGVYTMRQARSAKAAAAAAAGGGGGD